MVNIESEKIVCQEFVGQFSSARYFITEWEVVSRQQNKISQVGRRLGGDGRRKEKIEFVNFSSLAAIYVLVAKKSGELV